jgi:hypothetical protein
MDFVAFRRVPCWMAAAIFSRLVCPQGMYLNRKRPRS